MSYQEQIMVSGSLYPMEDGKPLVNAKDIYVADGTNLKGKLDNMDALIGAGSNNKFNSAAIAPSYSARTPYSVGDLVTHDGGFFRCNTAISALGEEWNSAHWDAVTAQDIFMITAAGVDSNGFLTFTNGGVTLFSVQLYEINIKDN